MAKFFFRFVNQVVQSIGIFNKRIYGPKKHLRQKVDVVDVYVPLIVRLDYLEIYLSSRSTWTNP